MRDSRGQLLLIGAVVIAVVIVGVVVFLNGVQYTQGLGSGDNYVVAANAEATQRAIQVDLRRLLWQVGADGPYVESGSELNELQTAVRTYSDVSANMTGASGTAVTRLTLQMGDTEDGSAAIQDTEQQFSKIDGPSGPTVNDRVIATNIDSIVAIRMNVTQGRSSTAPFTLNVSSSGASADNWFLRVTERGVEVESDGTTRQLCEPADIDSSEAVIVDIQGQHGQIRTTNDTVDCGSFDVAPTIGDPQYVVFNNSHHATGTYDVTVTGEGAGWAIEPSAVPDHEKSAVVNPAYRLVYERPEMSYTTAFQTYNTTEP